MNTRTKRNLILSLCLFSGSVAIFALMMYQIRLNGAVLDHYVAALSEKSAQEVAFIKVKRLVEETEVDRNNLTQAFFADESDSISFLGDVEAFARSVQIELKTEGLDKIKAPDNTEYITMTFVYSGDERRVKDFTTYLETLPYHAKVEALKLEKDFNNSWKGMLTLNITIAPL